MDRSCRTVGAALAIAKIAFQPSTGSELKPPVGPNQSGPLLLRRGYIATLSSLLLSLRRLLPTLLLGLAGGAIAFALHLPLPWLLGAMLATTAASLGGIRLEPPSRSRRGVLVVIGVMLGSAFTPSMLGDLGPWTLSLGVMLVTTVAMMAFSVWFSRYIAGHSPETALYAGVPGGVSMVTTMAIGTDADLRVVGITHAVRIMVLLVAIPPVLQAIGHIDLGNATPSLNRWASMPAPADVAWLTAAGVGGVWLGRWLRLPNALLFGPALVSAMLHVTDVTEASIPPMLIALAQVLIGASIGVRFAGTSLVLVGKAILMAVVQTLVLLVMAIVCAWVGHLLTGYSAAAALLAYMPGGAPELSLVALTLGVDPAFVTAHHLLRISLLALLLPFLGARFAAVKRRINAE